MIGPIIAVVASSSLLRQYALGRITNPCSSPVAGIWRVHEVVLSLDRALVSPCAVVEPMGFQLFMKHMRAGVAIAAFPEHGNAASRRNTAQCEREPSTAPAGVLRYFAWPSK